MKYFWFPLCLFFAFQSYGQSICGGNLLSQMWFMWLIMSLVHVDAYVDLAKRKMQCR